MGKVERTQYQSALAITGTWQGTNRSKRYEELGGGKHFLTVVGAGAFSRYTKLKSTRPLLNCYAMFVNFWVAMALAYFSTKPCHLLFSQKRKLKTGPGDFPWFNYWSFRGNHKGVQVFA